MSDENKMYFLLVMHDDAERASVEKTIRKRFLEGDCSIAEACSAEQAMRVLQDFPCDVCFLDAELPGKDSLSFLQSIADRAMTFPVIVLAEPGQEPQVSAALRKGAKQHLIKSALSPELVAATVRYVRVLGNHEKRRADSDQPPSQNRNRQQHLLSSIGSILIGVRHDGIVTHWNRAAEKVFGVSAEYAVGRQLADCPIGWSFDFIDRAIRVCLSENNPVSVDDIPYLRSEGEPRLLGFSINPIQQEGEGRGEVLLFGADITEKRKATEELKAYTRQLERANAQIRKDIAKDEAILAGIGEGLVLTDETGRITLVNRQAILMFRWPGREVIGKNLVSEIAIQEESGQKIAEGQHPVEQVLKTGRRALAAGSYIFKDKTELPVQITASPVVLDGKLTGVISIFRDLTKEKELDRTKTEFVSTVSHELRTPLTSIRESVSQVHEGILGNISADQKEFLGIALDELDRLGAIINDLLDISKIESGKVVLKKSWVDFKELAEQLVLEYQPLVRNKRLEIYADVPDDSVEAFCDPEKIKQVLTNLLVNAYKFTPEGGRITLKVERTPEEVRVTVEDTGIGISAQSLPKLFGKFVQIGRTEGPGIKGTGLGLAICKSFVEMHQGKISVESQPGAGSRFIFSLPRMDADGAAKENIQHDMNGSQKLSILLIKLFRPRHFETAPGGLKPQYVLRKFIQKVRRESLEDDQDIYLNGSDEALVVLPGMGKEKSLEFAEILQNELHGLIRKVQQDGANPFVIHVGVSCYPDDAHSTEDLLSGARFSAASQGGGIERRAAVRVEMRMPVQLKTGRGPARKAVSADLSECGAKIFASKKLAVGNLVEAVIRLPEDHGQLKLQSMVAWVRECAKGEPFEIGLRFIGISEAVKNKLHQFLESYGRTPGNAELENRKIA
ncbi:MAG: PAS domain-containing protein [Candidatus Omnitrophica bacterium]|nr:PAS domain-containing protein [Candidatus Omnitrophota bacterium]